MHSGNVFLSQANQLSETKRNKGKQMKTIDQQIQDIIEYYKRLKNPEPCKPEEFSQAMIKAHNIKFD